MTAKNIISYLEAKRTLEGYRHKNICVTFQSLRSQAKLFALHEIYSKAIEWYEKAFELGLQHIDHIEKMDILKLAWDATEHAYDLPRGDRNFWAPIWIAKKCLHHFTTDEWDLYQSVFMAWVVIREYKPFLDIMSLDVKAALYMLEHTKKHYPTFGYEVQQPVQQP